MRTHKHSRTRNATMNNSTKSIDLPGGPVNTTDDGQPTDDRTDCTTITNTTATTTEAPQLSMQMQTRASEIFGVIFAFCENDNH